MRNGTTYRFFSTDVLWLCLIASQLACCGSSGNEEGFRAFQEYVYPYMRKNCMPCHATRAPRVSSSDLREAYQSAKSHVDFKEIPKSSLVEKTHDGHCGRACKADVTPLIDAIEKWVKKERMNGT